MAFIEVNDIFDALTHESEKLFNELVIANQCLNVLIEFKTFVDSVFESILEQNLNENQCKKYKEINKRVFEVLDKRGVNLSSDSNQINSENLNNNEVSDEALDSMSFGSELLRRKSSEECFASDSESELRVNGNDILFCDHIGCLFQTKSQTLLNCHKLMGHLADNSEDIPIDCEPIDIKTELIEANNTVEDNSETNESIPHLPEISATSRSTVKKSVINKTFVCDVCSKSFRCESILKVHRRIHPKNVLLEVVNKRWQSLRRIDSIINPNFDKNMKKKSIRERRQSLIQALTCHLCGAVFKAKIDLKAHKLSHASKRKPPKKRSFRCAYCRETFVTERSLKAHTLSHTEKNLEVSGHTMKKRTKPMIMDVGPTVQYPQPPTKTWKGSYVCKFCGDSFKSPQTHRKHMNNHYKERALLRKKSMEKAEDGREGQTNDSRKQFIITHCTGCQCKAGLHLFDSQVCLCLWPQCRYIAVNIETTPTAVSAPTKQPTVSSPTTPTDISLVGQTFKCYVDGCGQQFTLSSQLSEHVANTHSPNKEDYTPDLEVRDPQLEEIQFSCEWPRCTFKSTRFEMVPIHKKECHQSGPPYVCDEADCSAQFKWRRCLFAHMYLVHPKPDLDTEYACEWPGCDYRSFDQKKVKRHMTRLHEENTWVECDHPGCGLRFKSNCEMKYHKQRVHLNVKKFDCSWPGCTYKAWNKAAVDKHLMSHTKEKPFACDWPECQFRSSQKTNVKTHMANVHQKKASK